VDRPHDLMVLIMVAKESWGAVVGEMRINALVILVCGVALLLMGAAQGLSTVLIGTVGGVVTALFWWWIKWQPMLRKSIAGIQVVVGRVEAESPKCTVLRALMRMSLGSGTVSMAMIVMLLVADDPHNVLHIGDGFVAGMWFSVAIFYLTGAQRLRRWEVEHDHLVVRDMRRWKWSICEAHGQRPDGGRVSRRRWCFFAIQPCWRVATS